MGGMIWPSADFWIGRRVLLTGHTGFKGSWLALWLHQLGAKIFGIGLNPEGDSSLHDQLHLPDLLDSHIVDIRNLDITREVFAASEPEIVIHMAAQALVLESIRDPVATFASNVMGTANLLQAVRDTQSVRAVLVVTSDKVYANNGIGRRFTETDALGGDDPYSASKSATEHVALAFGKTYFDESRVKIATARAGNIIGAGDWSENRLVPDIVRAIQQGNRVSLRHPEAVRPWQWVLEPLRGYLLQIEDVCSGRSSPHAINFGPSDGQVVTVGDLTRGFLRAWGKGEAEGWQADTRDCSVEKSELRLDPSLAKTVLSWRCALTQAQAVKWTAMGYKQILAGEPTIDVVKRQMADYHGLVAAMADASVNGSPPS